jgi:DNA-binding NarL/FixJ family response regulator
MANCLGDEQQGTAWLTPQVQDAKEMVPQSIRQLKTYLVEDSPVIRDSLIATLEELVPVAVVGTAEDEMSAVQWLTQPNNPVDLVIVDIFLKGGSGLGVLRAVNRLPHRYKLVVLSNYATEDIRRKCLELGADRVFDKSNEIEALILYCSQLAGDEAGAGAPG